MGEWQEKVVIWVIRDSVTREMPRNENRSEIGREN